MLAALYRIYERRLTRQVRAQPVPRHVGVILDGNRRHGRQHQLTDPDEVYAVGADKLDELQPPRRAFDDETDYVDDVFDPGDCDEIDDEW